MKKDNIHEKHNSIEKTLLTDSKLETNKLFEKYKTSLEGISVVEEDDRLEEYGKNVIE